MTKTKRIRSRTAARRADWREHLPPQDRTRLTTAELARKHLAALAAEDSPSIDDWQTFYREFVTDFGEVPLDEHTTDMWEGWLRARERDEPRPAAKTVGKKLGLAGAAYQYARRIRAIETNPIHSLPRTARPSREVVNPERAPLSVLSAAELRLVFGEGVVQVGFFDHLFFTGGALLGARFGELAGAVVADFHEDTAPLAGIHFRRQWHTKSRKVRNAPKDKRSKTVPTHPILHGLFRRMPHEFELRAGRPLQLDDPLFPFFPENAPADVRRWNQRTALRRWRVFQAEVGIPDPVCGPRTIHHLRHTFISRLVCDDASESAIRSCTHPRSVRATSDAFSAYRHMSWEAKCAAILKLNLDSVPASVPPAQLRFEFSEVV